MRQEAGCVGVVLGDEGGRGDAAAEGREKAGEEVKGLG